MQKCLFPLSIFKILSPHRYLLTFSLTSHFSTPSQSPYSIPHSFFSPPLPLPPPSLGRSAGGRQWQERRDAPRLLLHSPVGARRAGVAAAVTSSASDGAGMAVLGFFFPFGEFYFFRDFLFSHEVALVVCKNSIFADLWVARPIRMQKSILASWKN